MNNINEILKIQEKWKQKENNYDSSIIENNINNNKINEIQSRLNSLDNDFLRAAIGIKVANIPAKKEEFYKLYVKICQLKGKEPDKLKDETFNI